MDGESNPDAQGQQAGAETPAQSAQGEQSAVVPQSSGVPEGFQQRINELTARFHEEKRARVASEERINQLTGALLQQAQQFQPQHPPQPDPLAEMDPEERKRLQAFVAPLQQQMQQMNLQHSAQLAGMEARQVAASQGLDERIVTRAQQLAAGWAMKGLPFSPADATTFALGEVTAGERARATQAQREQGLFASTGPLMGHGAPTSLSPPTVAPLPQNFDDLPPEQQIALLEKRGVDNQRF